MTASSLWPLQQAVFAALGGDPALKALIGDPARVFDHVPANSAFPYVVIGEATARDWDTKTDPGMEQNLSVHTWSRARGAKETKQIMAAIVATLDHAPLAVAGHALVLIRFEFAQTLVDPDGLTHHGVQRFRAITQKAG
ncbi:MAG: DUF3168 domain-containing protein [Kiloniellaceae bacterium]